MKPLIDSLGLPIQLRVDTEIKFEENEISVNLVNNVTADEIKKIIDKEKIQFIIEFFGDKPSGLLSELENRPISFGICLKENKEYDISDYRFYDEIWGFHSSFPNIIPPGLFLDNYQIYRIDKKYNLTYIGTASDEKADLITSLLDNGVDIKIWGYGWEKYKQLRHIARGFLPHWEMQKVIAQSGRSLFFSEDYKNKRLEILASGGSPYEISLSEHSDTGNKNLIKNIKEQTIQDTSIKITNIPDNSYLIQDINRKLEHHLPNMSRKKNHHQPHYTVSIFCYIYNQAKYIEQLILSVLGQSYKNFELFILDDGSTDETQSIVQKYLYDKRIRYVYQDNICNKLDAFDRLIHRCLDMTNSTYIAFIGGDDIMYPHRLKQQMEIFGKDPEVDLIYTNFKGIQENGFSNRGNIPFQYNKRIPQQTIARELFNSIFVHHPTTIMTRKSIEEMGGFLTPFYSDLYFWVHAAPYIKYAYIENPTILYRYHKNGSSTGKAQVSPLQVENYNVLMRSRAEYTILNYYEEIDAHPNKDEAIYEAYIQFSSIMAFSRAFIPELIIQNSWRALEHQPYGLEALNHLLIASMLDKNHDVAKVYNYVEKNISQLQNKKKYPIFSHMLNLIKKEMKQNPESNHLIKYWIQPTVKVLK